MPMRMLTKTTMLVLAMAAAPAAVADPNPLPRVYDGRFILAQQDGLTLSEAVEMVRRRCNCRIVSAETRRSGNREVHIIKVLTEDGQVRTERIPGRSTRG